VKLLSLLDHPSVPRLLDSGVWRHPSGTQHPYIVMAWVEGMSLYDWAREHPPSSQQVLRLLAQLARGLEAVHALGAVHRDVKGANVLVRLADGQALLTDFGSGIHPGASTLTPPSEVPGTPAYLSPEASLFPLRFMRNADARYAAGPGDDLYALGVTAYRLVTGRYPEPGEPFKDETGFWQPGELTSPSARTVDPRLDPRLDALILQMLSPRPEKRGSTAELAQALEQAASAAATARTEEAPASPEEPVCARHFAELAERRVQARLRRSWLAVAASGLTLMAWSGWASLERVGEKRSVARVEARGPAQQGTGKVGLAEAVSSASTVEAMDAGVPEGLAEDTLPEPLPGQARPDANGRCPGKGQLSLNGGCWVQIPFEREKCEGSGYVFTSQCYGPVLSHPRKREPTSNPGHQQ
jgi:hypothetical protein